MQLLTIVVVLLTGMLPSRGQAPSSPTTVAQMRDLYRPVLIFAPTRDPRLKQQVETFSSHRNDLIERQIMLVPSFDKYAGPVDREIITFLPQEEPFLRKRFHVSDKDFTVILIGKDGGEKLRSSEVLPFDKLRNIIDAMPMRRQEVQNSPAVQKRAKP